jgi:RimJ/RimL family protein N-acetyltransferase
LVGWHFPYSTHNTEKWIDSINNNDMKNQIFAIDTSEHGLIGTTNLVNIDWKNRNAFHGIMLGNIDTRGKGYALDCVMAIMRYAFDELGLERLDGDMISSNERSINFYIKKCGWVIEGKKENWFYRDGQYHDKIIVGITKNMYYKLLQTNHYWDSK